MTAVLQDYDAAIDGGVVKPEQRYQAVLIAGVIAVAVLVAALGLFFAVPSLHQDVVTGTPTANRVEVIQAAADRKAQAEADQKAAELAYLQSMDRQVKTDVQKVIDAKGLSIPITVIDVGLIKVGPNKYEGMATMQAAGYSSHQVAIHVTADDQNIMWNLDNGALYALFY